MTAGGYGSGYGPIRATDLDRENVRSMLQDAHAQGRLSWDEFDSRSTALMNAQTYDQLTALTADLPGQVPVSPQQGYQQQGYQQQGYQPMPYGGQRQTNGLAIASLICGVCQIFFWFVAGIPAIVLGHMARRQIKQTGEDGAGLALAGMLLGYAGLVLTILFGIAVALLAVAAAHSGNVNNGSFPSQ